ncbi:MULTISPECIES: hypothetical protein [Rickettsieae]|jgi:uncharacterized UPF0160 family protein|uniref:hypothetical protein n=1 Tax=Rickettsieae TaxID=33988 RepID=UPI000B9C2617|nr:hypothetical protein [Rickettsia endosymbiont of Culicoides newsteadi]MDN3031259.1 hypothetical protein [Candidatus Tisiphia sp.]OZG31474.1 hypothetical protein RiCNE_11310 [Rickettsia endosymbiont of Culicoides newsteadi]
MSNNNHEQCAAELKEIKSKLFALSGMVQSLLWTVGNSDFKQESYMKMLIKQQSDLQQKIDYICCYIEVKKQWDEEDYPQN